MAFRDRLVKTATSLKNTIGGLRETAHLVDNTLIIKLSQKHLLGRERLIVEPVRRGATISFGRELHPAPYLLCIDYKTGER
ncbi:hypothetical protein, partial [Persicitalea sp.]|uniref:hypothetical protein n=1 Tax=Persicitalea sp. TaxID=3100273 RepID=UPI0035931820